MFKRSVNALCGGDVCVAAAILIGNGLLEVCDVGGEIIKESCGHFVPNEFGFERHGVAGKGAGCAEQCLIVIAARQTETVCETGIVDRHRTGGAVDSL